MLQSVQEVRFVFLKMFDSLLKENNLNKRQFSIKSGIPYTTVDGFYKKGYENIRLTTLKKIANFFGVSLDFLILGKDYTETVSDANNSTLELQYKIKKLNSLGKKKADEYIEDLLENPKYTEGAGEQNTISDDIANDIRQTVSRPINTK